MSKFPAPDRECHDTFCVTEAWLLVRGSNGKPVKHHRTYELVVEDGNILRTRISQPVNRTTYAPSTWSHILRDQLKVTATDFWACVNDRVLPSRGLPRPSSKALPLHVLNDLITRVGMTPETAVALTLDEALEEIRQYWAKHSTG